MGEILGTFRSYEGNVKDMNDLSSSMVVEGCENGITESCLKLLTSFLASNLQQQLVGPQEDSSSSSTPLSGTLSKSESYDRELLDIGEYADDATWVLTASFIILTMQSGFGLLEMGCSMPGNEVHIMVKNVVDVIFGSLSYWLVGYAISFGHPSIPFMGLGDFALSQATASISSSNMNNAMTEDDMGNSITSAGLTYSQYMFQFSFAATATTIVSGMIAMRMKFNVYCIFSFVSVIFYGFCAHWVWAENGWLNAMGYHDFAGGGPVHLFGAMNGLVGMWMVGPRTGIFKTAKRKSKGDDDNRNIGEVESQHPNEEGLCDSSSTIDRPSSAFRAVSPTSMLFGLFMLWWGWIGFNCGSTFGITGGKWIVATRAAICTINCTAGGGMVALIWSLIISRHERIKGRRVIEVEYLVNGILGSLVSSSPTCASTHTYSAIIIGAVGAFISITVSTLVKRNHYLKLDDPVGAFGVHGAGAVWGILAVGLFADSSLLGAEHLIGNGLLYGGGFQLLGIQLLGVIAIAGWSILWSMPFFYICGVCASRSWRNPRKGLRVPLEEELRGADYYVHGIENDEDPTYDEESDDGDDNSCSIGHSRSVDKLTNGSTHLRGVPSLRKLPSGKSFVSNTPSDYSVDEEFGKMETSEIMATTTDWHPDLQKVISKEGQDVRGPLDNTKRNESDKDSIDIAHGGNPTSQMMGWNERQTCEHDVPVATKRGEDGECTITDVATTIDTTCAFDKNNNDNNGSSNDVSWRKKSEENNVDMIDFDKNDNRELGPNDEENDLYSSTASILAPLHSDMMQTSDDIADSSSIGLQSSPSSSQQPPPKMNIMNRREMMMSSSIHHRSSPRIGPLSPRTAMAGSTDIIRRGPEIDAHPRSTISAAGYTTTSIIRSRSDANLLSTSTTRVNIGFTHSIEEPQPQQRPAHHPSRLCTKTKSMKRTVFGLPKNG